MAFTPTAVTLPVLAALVCFAGVPAEEPTLSAVADALPHRLSTEEIDRLLQSAREKFDPSARAEPVDDPAEDETEVRYSHPQAFVRCSHPRIDRIRPALRPAARANLKEAFSRAEKWFDDYQADLEDEGPTSAAWDYVELWSVSAETDRLLSLSATVNHYSGGAHPNSHFRSRTVWIDGGELRDLRLADLFNPCASWEAELSVRVLRQLRADGASSVVDGVVDSLDARDLSPWCLTPQGIEFLFEPYRMGSYADGPFLVTVSFEEIRELLNPLGPATEFLR
jgi:hypothetical protein